jgi:hypothetical protein
MNQLAAGQRVAGDAMAPLGQAAAAQSLKLLRWELAAAGNLANNSHRFHLLFDGVLVLGEGDSLTARRAGHFLRACVNWHDSHCVALQRAWQVRAIGGRNVGHNPRVCVKSVGKNAGNPSRRDAGKELAGRIAEGACCTPQPTPLVLVASLFGGLSQQADQLFDHVSSVWMEAGDEVGLSADLRDGYLAGVGFHHMHEPATSERLTGSPDQLDIHFERGSDFVVVDEVSTAVKPTGDFSQNRVVTRNPNVRERFSHARECAAMVERHQCGARLAWSLAVAVQRPRKRSSIPSHTEVPIVAIAPGEHAISEGGRAARLDGMPAA